jgi:outer membrane lipoprotein carrier protein
MLIAVLSGISSGTDQPRMSADEFVSGIESRYRGVRTLKADFTQTYTSGGRKHDESGVAYFARGGLMRWDYQQPRAKLVVADGKYLWIYIPQDNQVTKSPLKANEDVRVPFAMLLSHLNLHRAFSKVEFAEGALKTAPGGRVLRAYPRHGYEDEYTQVLIEAGPAMDVRRLVVFYPDNSIIDFNFFDFQKNVTLEPALFSFTPPPGTEVIQQ